MKPRNERRKSSATRYDGPHRRAEDSKHRGASAKKSGTRQISWLHHLRQQHRLAARWAIERVLKTRLASSMTIAVIGIALALPAALQVLVKNSQQLTSSSTQQNQITLYLKTGLADSAAMDFASQIEQRPDIESVEFMGSEDALKEFKKTSGFADALEQLTQNPLPSLIIAYPSIGSGEAEKLAQLQAELAKLPEVDSAQLDLTWLQRLFAILDLLKQASLLVTVFLVIAVVAVVGNTIRLMSQSYRDEIRVSKLVGATDSFVRRPFLYSGAIYGCMGAILALLTVWGGLLALSGPISALSALYQGSFELLGLNLTDALLLLAIGSLLGLGGSWIAVNHYLHEVDI